MLAIARSELIQIFRDRLILVPVLAIPVVVSTYFAYQHEIFSDLVSLGYIAVLPLIVIALMQVAAILTVFAMPSHRRSLDVDLGVAP